MGIISAFLDNPKLRPFFDKAVNQMKEDFKKGILIETVKKIRIDRLISSGIYNGDTLMKLINDGYDIKVENKKLSILKRP